MDLLRFPRHLLAVVPDAEGIEVAHLCRRGGNTRVVDHFRINTRVPAHSSRVEDLRQQLEKRHLQKIPCIFCLRSSLFSVKTLRIPPGSASFRIRDRVQAHLEEFEHLSESKALTDYTLTSLGTHRYLMMFTVREDTLFEEIRLIKDAGLLLKDVIPQPFAYFEGIRLAFPCSPGYRIAISIGHDHCDLVLGDDRGPLHLRSIPIPVSPPQSEPETASPANGRINHSLPAPWLADLSSAIAHIREEIRPDSTPFRDIIISGYRLPDETQRRQLEKSLSLPVLLYPESSPASASALGLSQALRSAAAGPPVSLLPSAQRLAARQYRFTFCWILTCLLLLLTLLAYTLHLRQQNVWLDRVRARTETLATHYQVIQRQREDLAARDAELRRKVLPLRNTRRNQFMVNRLTRALYLARSEQDWFVLLSDADSYFSGVARARLAPNPTETRLRFIVEGYTSINDLSTVRSMIENLRKQSFIRSVDLLPDDQIRSIRLPELEGNVTLRRFALEIVLQGGGA